MSVVEPSPRPAFESLLQEVSRLALSQGRADLTARLVAAEQRVSRPDTIVAVVGEFKQGKSSLVNGLVGEAVCPVDDDLATSTLTLIRHGNAGIGAWLRDNNEQRVEQIPAEHVADFATETGNPANRRRVDLIEVQLDNPFLARGVALLDTPGVGGLTPGYTGTTLANLHIADAALLVSDATTSLTASEVEFLTRAAEVCPSVALVVTKIDLSPDWRRIVELDASALAEGQLPVPTFPVSTPIRQEALRRRDPDLNAESGFPDLLSFLAEHVLDPVREHALERAGLEVSSAADQLATVLEAEERTLTNPESVIEQSSLLEAERQRLERLRSGNARWQTMLNDEFSDLLANVEHRFRQEMRTVGREADERIEASDPGEAWTTLAGEVRERAAIAAIRTVRDLEGGADRLAAKVIAMLREESIQLESALGRARPVDVSRLWNSAAPATPSFAESAASGWSSLRGAQGGIMVFGMLGNLAGIALTSGMMAGVGLLFGGKQLLEERRRQLTSRRQKARTAIRQFLDDVQFETGKSMRDVSRELQRQLRDGFSERIAESIRTCTASSQALQAGLQREEASRGARLEELRRDLAVLAEARMAPAKASRQ